MKLDRQKLENAYISKVNQICDDCEDKEHFSIPEIIGIIAGLIDTGVFYLPSHSNLYTQEELDHQCLLSYNGGLADGLDQAASSHDIGFRPQD